MGSHRSAAREWAPGSQARGGTWMGPPGAPGLDVGQREAWVQPLRVHTVEVPGVWGAEHLKTQGRCDSGTQEWGAKSRTWGPGEPLDVCCRRACHAGLRPVGHWGQLLVPWMGPWGPCMRGSDPSGAPGPMEAPDPPGRSTDARTAGAAARAGHRKLAHAGWPPVTEPEMHGAWKPPLQARGPDVGQPERQAVGGGRVGGGVTWPKILRKGI